MGILLEYTAGHILLLKGDYSPKPSALETANPARRSVELKHGRIAMLATMGGLERQAFVCLGFRVGCTAWCLL